MKKTTEIAIIGAGSAGLSAFKEAKRYTKNVLLIDSGPLGTTCARVGCMPSKVMIQAANDFFSRHAFSKQGIEGAEHLNLNIPKALAYVRKMRDHFTKGVIESTRSLGKQFLEGQAKFISENQLQVKDQIITANAIIIATGTKSIVPKAWQTLPQKILTSETIFEQRNLKNSIAVIGAGAIGLEFGQALSRFGIDISVYHRSDKIGGLSDPKVNDVAVRVLEKEFKILHHQKVELNAHHEQICVQGTNEAVFDQVIAAMGRESQLKRLGLEALPIQWAGQDVPVFHSETMQIGNLPIYIAGDVNQYRAILHEASNEGRMAAYNATHPGKKAFKRSTPMYIVFTEPEIAMVGCTYEKLALEKTIIGEIDFSDQGRSKIMHQNQGILRIYADQASAKLIGAEMIAPAAEHLAHLIAWAIEQELTVFDVLNMPFYHPVVEEGLRTALRDLARQIKK